MSELPAGTVTFFLTDLEGSTSLWDRAPQEMARALARHDEIVADAIARAGGRLVKSRGEGDSVFAVFASAPDAVACALALQCTFAGEDWPTPQPLRARVALHTGEAELRGDDYFGPAVNRSARLRELAHGEQVLLSETTAELIRGRVPQDASLRSLGLHRLRDLSRPERVFQLIHPRLRTEFPRLRSLEETPNNLPIQLTSFVGREREIEEVRAILDRNRLATIAGPGGAGKTRLALQVAGEMLDRFTDGVWLVEFGALTDADLVLGAVAAGVQVREEAGRGILQTLVEAMRDREILIVFDNCEHVVDECARVANELLKACPRARILATTREPLGISGEALWRVRGLTAPDPGAISVPADLSRWESTRLFVERAGGGALDLRAAEAIGEIARRLDGMPLAIELAAARTRVLSPVQIAARIEDRFRLLTGGSRTAMPRHQTLRALIDWSHELLSVPERTVFRRVAVFAGDFSVAAVEAVAAGDGTGREEVLPLLVALESRSLLVADTTTGETRFRLLETIREYARERLGESPDARATRDRHLAWCLELAERAEPSLTGPDQRAWLDTLEAAHGNMRTALVWGINRRSVERYLRLSAALAPFWEMHGHWTEGRAWLAWGIEEGEGSPDARAKALLAAGKLAHLQADHAAAEGYLNVSLVLFRTAGDRAGEATVVHNLGNLAQAVGDYPVAQDRYFAALEIRRSLGDRAGTAGSLANLGFVSSSRGDYDVARPLYEEALSIFRELGNARGVAIMLHNLGNAALAAGDFDGARAMFSEALDTQRSLGDRRLIAGSLTDLANVAYLQGDFAAARPHYEEGLALRREIGDRRGAAGSLTSLGALAHHLGDRAAARASYRESLEITRALGDKRGIAHVCVNLGTLHAEEGDPSGARELLVEAMRLWRALGQREGIVECLEGFAVAARFRGDWAVTASLVGAVTSLREELGIPMPPFARDEFASIIAAARDALGTDEFEQWTKEGQAMRMEEAVVSVLGEHGP